MTAESNYQAHPIPIGEIFVVGDRRAVNETAVNALVKSIKEIGLQTPITIRIHKGDVPDPETGEVLDCVYAIVAGRHRLEACRRLGWQNIQAIVLHHCDEIDAEMIEIAENLHRLDLTKEQRDQQIRRYAELLRAREDTKIRVSQNETPEIGYKNPPPAQKGLARQIADATGLSKATVHRALNPNPKQSAQTQREPALDKHGDPDMRVVAHRLATKHTIGELQSLIDHLTDIIKEQMGHAA